MGEIFSGPCRQDWFYCCCTLRPLSYPSLIALLRMDIINVNHKGALFDPFFKWSFPQKDLQNYCRLSLLHAQQRGFLLLSLQHLFSWPACKRYLAIACKVCVNAPLWLMVFASKGCKEFSHERPLRGGFMCTNVTSGGDWFIMKMCFVKATLCEKMTGFTQKKRMRSRNDQLVKIDKFSVITGCLWLSTEYKWAQWTKSYSCWLLPWHHMEQLYSRLLWCYGKKPWISDQVLVCSDTPLQLLRRAARFASFFSSSGGRTWPQLNSSVHRAGRRTKASLRDSWTSVAAAAWGPCFIYGHPATRAQAQKVRGTTFSLQNVKKHGV